MNHDQIEPEDLGTLLRGVSVKSLISNAGTVFDSNTSSCESWQLSRQLNGRALGSFISHSWRSRGSLKALALLYEFNSTGSMVAGHVAALLLLALQLALRHAGVALPVAIVWEVPMPEWSRAWRPAPMWAGTTGDGHVWAGVQGIPITGICTVGSCLVALAYFFGGHKVRGRQMAFVDRVCINQDNDDLKLQGVLHIDEFLRISERIVILWDADYFERLWCNFELAMFTSEKGVSDATVHLLPLTLPVFALGLFVTLAAGLAALAGGLTVFTRLWGIFDLSDMATFLTVYMLLSVLFWWIWKCVFCRTFVRHRELMDAQIDNFSCRQARCSVEADRAFVEAHITQEFGSLENFDRFVRGGGLSRRFGGQDAQGLKGVVRRQMGTTVPLSAILFENFPAVLAICYDAVALAGNSDAVGIAVLAGLLEYVVLNPLFIALLMAFSKYVEARRRRLAAAIPLGALMFATAGNWLAYLLIVLFNAPMWVPVALLILGLPIVHHVYGWPLAHILARLREGVPRGQVPVQAWPAAASDDVTIVESGAKRPEVKAVKSGDTAAAPASPRRPSWSSAGTAERVTASQVLPGVPIPFLQ